MLRISFHTPDSIDMIDKIDALIIARDNMHYEISRPFLIRKSRISSIVKNLPEYIQLNKMENQ